MASIRVLANRIDGAGWRCARRGRFRLSHARTSHDAVRENYPGDIHLALDLEHF